MDTLTGDFIERHALAASLRNNITVLFAVRDVSLSPGDIKRETRTYNNSCSAQIIYYGARNSFSSAIRYFSCFKKLINEHICANGKPDFIHVHVVFRAGLMALYAKYRYGIRYFITEHWSLFNDAAPVNFKRLSFFKRYLIGSIYKNAFACTAVSHHLSASIKNKIGVREPLVIPNVFDPSLFYPEERKDDGVFKFIHISQLNYAKNADQIIEAADILYSRAKDFRLTIYGPYNEAISNKINRNYTDYQQEVPQKQLAGHLRGHDALILYSRYEGLPCVVIEALAAGVPVIVSDIPSMHELVTENMNGSIVPLNEPRLLAEKMQEFMERRISFDAGQISAAATEKYSYENVGKLFDELYNSMPTSPKRGR